MKKILFIVLAVVGLGAVEIGGFKFGFDRGAQFDKAKGEATYNHRCKNCHGSKGERRADGIVKISELSGDEIFDAFFAYRNFEYGGRWKKRMQPVAQQMTYKELAEVIVFLKGDDAFKK